jgi:hypothetical protein
VSVSERAKYLERTLLPNAERAVNEELARMSTLQLRAQEMEAERQRELHEQAQRLVRTSNRIE